MGNPDPGSSRLTLCPATRYSWAVIKKILPVVLLLLLAGCPATRHRGPRKSPRPRTPLPITGTREVVRVIDGDTVVLNGGERVRINYINTPEKREELGPEAGAFARERFQGARVKVEGNTRDGYGRLLGDVIAQGKSLAQTMVAHGLAHVFLIPPYDTDKVKLLMAAQARARDKKLGIWDTGRYQGNFHITSFHANPPGKDKFNLNGEYLRIANITTDPQSLSGYTLSNRAKDQFVFGEVIIPAGHTVIVSSGHGTDQPDPKKQIRMFWRRKSEAWSNWGDTATLRDSEGKVVDEVIHKPKRRR